MTSEDAVERAPSESHHRPRAALDCLAVWLSWGFGIGRIRWAPGTFGTLPGLAWFCVLLLAGDVRIFALGCLLSVMLAVWACGRAEIVLKRHDPPSVVLDEIVAVPLCFTGLLMMQTLRSGFPDLAGFYHYWPAWVLPAGFVAFRVLDIAKPWPIGRVQSLPGGWGVVADDLLAGLAVGLLGFCVPPA